MTTRSSATMSMNTKHCELCKGKAGIYCEPDHANLCWDCDARVHAANFLVARHSRNLLCHLCRNPTPWKASGPKLTLTLSLCQQCLRTCRRNVDLDSSYIHHTGPNEQEVVEENHVVPGSPPPPPPEEEDEECNADGSDHETETGRTDK